MPATLSGPKFTQAPTWMLVLSGVVWTICEWSAKQIERRRSDPEDLVKVVHEHGVIGHFRVRKRAMDTGQKCTQQHRLQSLVRRAVLYGKQLKSLNKIHETCLEEVEVNVNELLGQGRLRRTKLGLIQNRDAAVPVIHQ